MVANFTGGIISPKTLANLDSKGEGPPNIRVGGKIAYDVTLFVQWLEARVTGKKSREVSK
jgi:hypothetical protein